MVCVLYIAGEKMSSGNWSFYFSNVSGSFITCQSDYSENLKEINIIRTVTAGISTFASLTALVLLFYLICRKSWDTLSHRLIACFLVSAFFYSLATVFQWVRLVYDETDSSKVIGCEVLGFFVEYFSWTLMLMTFFLIFHLFDIVYNKPLDRFFARCKITSSNSRVPKWLTYLGFYVIVSYGLPLLIVWIPFIPSFSGYGLSGYWCWIEVCDPEGHPYIAGYILQALMWYLPIMIVSLVIGVLVGVVLWKMCNVKKKTDIVSCPLFAFPFVFLIVNIVAFANRVVVLSIGHPYVGLAFLHGFIDPLWGSLASVTLFTYVGIVWCMDDSKPHPPSSPGGEELISRLDSSSGLLEVYLPEDGSDVEMEDEN